MIVYFKYLGLKNDKISGEVKKVEIEKGSDIQFLIKTLRERYDLSEEVFKACNYMVNNKRADLNTKLKDGDYVLVMKVLGGG